MKYIESPELEIDKQLYSDGKIPANGKLERRIVTNLFAQLNQQGFSIVSVNDGEEEVRVSSAKAAMELIFNLDEAHVYFSKGTHKHWLFLVLGNGTDIISDWGVPHPPTGFDELLMGFNAEDFE